MPNNAKNNILKRIREAARHKTPLPYPDTRDNVGIVPPPPAQEELALLFAKNFTAIDGKFHFCQDTDELMDTLQLIAEQQNWQHLYCWDKAWQEIFTEYSFRQLRIGHQLDRADGSITTCERLIARTGSILMSSNQGRTLSVFPHIHIVIATMSQVVYDIGEAVAAYHTPDQFPSFLSIATGPSRTADIEKTLVMGAHGPKEVHIFMLDDTQ